MSDLSAFEFFKQETTHSGEYITLSYYYIFIIIIKIDVVVRTEAMSNVAIVAALMGPDKTRTDMLPYLQSKLFSNLVFNQKNYYYSINPNDSNI